VNLFHSVTLDIEGNPPNPPLWMHLSRRQSATLNGFFVYSSDEYDDE
jgi:hypothetical protein